MGRALQWHQHNFYLYTSFTTCSKISPQTVLASIIVCLYKKSIVWHIKGLRGYCISNLKLACFVCYLKIINTFLCRLPWQERHIGITLSPVVVCWCCCPLWKRVNIWLYLPHALMDFNQSWVIDATWKPSFVDEVRGHISRSKVIWGQYVKCENGLIWKVEVWFDPNSNLVYWYNMWPFICSCSQRSCTKVKGHLRSSFKIGWKCENALIWKVQVWFEPLLCSKNLHPISLYTKKPIKTCILILKHLSKTFESKFSKLWIPWSPGLFHFS